MPLFAVVGRDKPGMHKTRAELRDVHRDFARSLADRTKLAGALYDDEGRQCGTVKIFEAESIEELQELYREEPFLKAGVYAEFTILEWRLALNMLPVTDGYLANAPTGKE